MRCSGCPQHCLTRRNRWTPAMLDKAEFLHRAGHTLDDIGQMFGVSAQQMSNVLRANQGYQPRPDGVALRAEDAWRLYHDAGWNLRTIGAAFGITHQRVQQILAEHPAYTAVQAEKKAARQFNHEQIRKAAEAGELDPRRLGQRLGMSHNDVAAVMRAAGYVPARAVQKLPQAVAGRLPAGDHRHGSMPGYSAGCRCEPCRDANRRQLADQKFKRLERGLPPGDPRHGTATAYMNWNCRCELCRAAGSQENRRKRAARPDTDPAGS